MFTIAPPGAMTPRIRSISAMGAVRFTSIMSRWAWRHARRRAPAPAPRRCSPARRCVPPGPGHRIDQPIRRAGLRQVTDTARPPISAVPAPPASAIRLRALCKTTDQPSKASRPRDRRADAARSACRPVLIPMPLPALASEPHRTGKRAGVQPAPFPGVEYFCPRRRLAARKRLTPPRRAPARGCAARSAARRHVRCTRSRPPYRSGT
jgi:hypothetical protein